MRNSNRPAALLCVLVFGMALFSPASFAIDKKGNKERDAARRLQIMQQQLAQEKAALEKDKSDLTQKVDELSKQAESAKQGVAQLERKRSALGMELSSAKKEITSLQEKLHQSEIAHTELVALHKQETEKNQQQISLLQSALALRGQALGSCEQKNGRLYELNRDILAQYRAKGLLDSLTQAEPVTGIKSVEVENILEEYRDKLDAQRAGGTK